MAYVKKSERDVASTPAEEPVTATAYSIVRAEGGYWQSIKWSITSDGKATADEISQPNLFPIIADQVERWLVIETQK